MAPVVSLSAGSGRLVKRHSVLLFDPSGENSEVGESFVSAATDSEAVSAAKSRLVASQFAMAPFVVVRWLDAAVELLVFGDVELSTSIAAAPMLTGAGSATWVERHLGAFELGDAASIEIWSGAETDSTTDLQLGSVLAGGFRLALSLSVDGSAPPAPQPTAAVQPASPAALSTPDLSAVDPAAEAASDPAPAESVGAEPASAEEEAQQSVEPIDWSDTRDIVSAQEHVGASPDPFDPSPAPAPAQSSGETAPSASAPVQSAPVAGDDPFAPVEEPEVPIVLAPSVEGEASDPFSHDPPTQPGQLPPVGADVFDAPAAVPAGSLVEASVCANGHANPPLSSRCAMCQQAIGADAPVVLIEQPSLGRLVFLDGDVVAIDRQIVIGRKPSVDDQNARALTIEHAEVSRSHASIVVEGWAVLLTDLGSRNGTYVCPPDNPTPLRLGEGVPHYLEDGTTVHLGGSEASFTYVVSTDVASTP